MPDELVSLSVLQTQFRSVCDIKWKIYLKVCIFTASVMSARQEIIGDRFPGYGKEITTMFHKNKRLLHSC